MVATPSAFSWGSPLWGWPEDWSEDWPGDWPEDWSEDWPGDCSYYWGERKVYVGLDTLNVYSGAIQLTTISGELKTLRKLKERSSNVTIDKGLTDMQVR